MRIMNFRPFLLAGTLLMVLLLPSCGLFGTFTLNPDGSLTGELTVPIVIPSSK